MNTVLKNYVKGCSAVMESDFFIDSYFSGINQTLTPEQQTIVLNLENIFKNSLRDDFGLLCNIYELYQTCKGSKSIDKDTVSTARITKEYRYTELLAKYFGLSERYIYRLLEISSKFIDFVAGDKKYKIPDLKEYSISKLQELLPLSLDLIRQAFFDGKLNFKSTREQIRSFVKSSKSINAKTVVEESVSDILTENKEQSVENSEGFLVSVTLPNDVYEFVRKQVLIHKKCASLTDYIVSVIREKM